MTYILQGVNFVKDKTGFPSPVGGVITLPANSSWYITQLIDLGGDVIECDGICAIVGDSTEVSRLTSTGKTASVPLISSEYSLTLRNIQIEDVDVALDLDASSNSNQSLDWHFVNFKNIPIVGTINTYDNFVGDILGFLEAGDLTFDGTIGTIAFNSTLFNNYTGKTSIIVPATCTITRRLRVIYSVFVSLSGETALNISSSATIPIESYILDTCVFFGGGTYLTGVDETSNKSLFVRNTNINNTAVNGQLYMQGNATGTTIANTSDYFKIAGTTTASADNSKFSHANNRLTCDAEIERTFLITCTLSFAAGNNDVCKFAFYDSKTSAIRTQSIITSTANAAGRAENITLSCVVRMKKNDFLEIHCRNTSSTTSIVVSDMNFVIIEK